MEFIIEFYKELDTVNTIIFWGFVIVVILLLIFSIMLINNNRKLKEIIVKNGISIDEEENIDLPIKYAETYEENKKEEHKEKNEDIIKEEKPFIVEEHIMDSNINKEKEQPVTKPENTLYQKNLLRDTSSNQTSPIGIINSNNNNQELQKAIELENALKREQNNAREKYLEEVSQKLSQANNNNKLTRTEYEIKEEEDAIISYKELMQKKDSIKIVDEEDAVISIEELIAREKQKEKIYNITEEEADKEFIAELKHFRSDL